MSEITVNFLGKEYSFPEELEKYVIYRNEFEKIYDELSNCLLIAMQKEIKPGNIPAVEAIEITIRQKMRQAGKKIISLLSQYGIYDVTERDLIDSNKGYLYYENVYNNMMHGLKGNLTEAMEDFLTGVENASREAYSQVTGTGFSIYSSSLIDQITYMAYERDTVKRQVRKADIEYNKALRALNKKYDSQREKRDTKIMIKTFAGIDIANRMFVDELLDEFLKKLQESNIFQYSLTKSYSIQRSSELLGNLEIVEDKGKVLELAFEQCPHNTDIYVMALELDLADKDTFITAQKFHQDIALIDYLENYCTRCLEDSDKLSMPLSVLAIYKNLSKVDVLKNLYKKELDYIKTEYSHLETILQNDKLMDKWICSNIVECPEAILWVSDQEVQEIISEKVTKILSEETYQKLVSKGILSVNDIRLKNGIGETRQEINAEFIKQLLNCVQKYRVDVSARKQKYDEVYEKFDFEVTQKKVAIVNKKKELDSLGIFAFAKKKELADTITKMEKELEDFKEKHEFNEVSKIFENMYE